MRGCKNTGGLSMKYVILAFVVAGFYTNYGMNDKYNKTQELHFAIGAENVKKVRALLQSGCDPNCKDELGNTPLYTASLVGNRTIFLLLVHYGADDTEKNYGQTSVRVKYDKEFIKKRCDNNYEKLPYKSTYNKEKPDEKTMEEIIPEKFFIVKSRL